MDLTKTSHGIVTVIEISGKLVGTVENCEKFHDVIRDALDAGSKQIVVGLRDTAWANSQGIGMLIGAFTSAKNAGAHLVLADVGTRIHDVLSVTRLTLIFEIFETVGEAVSHAAAYPIAASASTTDAKSGARRVDRPVDLGIPVRNGQE